MRRSGRDAQQTVQLQRNQHRPAADGAQVNRDSAFSNYPTRAELARESGGEGAPGGSYHKHTHVKLMAVIYTFFALLSLSLVLLATFKIVTEDSGYLVMFFVFLF